MSFCSHIVIVNADLSNDEGFDKFVGHCLFLTDLLSVLLTGSGSGSIMLSHMTA